MLVPQLQHVSSQAAVSTGTPSLLRKVRASAASRFPMQCKTISLLRKMNMRQPCSLVLAVVRYNRCHCSWLNNMADADGDEPWHWHSTPHVCDYCGYLFACQRCSCRRASYCDQVCAQRDWARHRLECRFRVIRRVTRLPCIAVDKICSFAKRD